VTAVIPDAGATTGRWPDCRWIHSVALPSVGGARRLRQGVRVTAAIRSAQAR
jgi:hypothetical protein